jgi:hypothetical protein
MDGSKYVGPNSPDYLSQPLYYWGGEPANSSPPYVMNYCSQVNPYTKASAPTSVPKSGSVTIDSIPSGADVYSATISGYMKLGVTPFVYTLPSTQKGYIL